ncbi:hypothetical protein [Actinoplanes sp. N902-109]|uniref:hypothetical protein n=1 Tax=Actinoplanes sp. (strain N902-109) TaxID=649831 RepID=UPI0003295897|nr:hypothetical protein [Actinoplanes sp. N902-109]AGL21559.1 hypothetical protein L083_8049 [Actinoplanes sp. N902-109]
MLESWNAADHPDQIRLRTYVDSVAEQLGVTDWNERGRRAIELVVGLPDSLPLDRGGRDLDNYLFPLARRLGPHRIAAAFGRKVHQNGSTIAVAPAMPTNDSATPALLTVRIQVSAQNSLGHDVVIQAWWRPCSS